MSKTGAKKGLMQFLREVRTEMKRVTWPNRKETGVSTLAVFIMVTLVSLFLYVADQVIAVAVRFILGF